MLRRLVGMLARDRGQRFERAVAFASGGSVPFGLQAPAPGLSFENDHTRRCSDRPVGTRNSGLAPDGIKHLLGPNVAERRAVILAPDGSVIRRHAGSFTDATTEGAVWECPSNVRTVFGHQGAHDAILIVDLAVFATLAAAVEWLHAFRYDFPEVVVIAGFEQFAGHDMSCERFLMADASVKLPVSRTALALAVSAAMTNHAFTMPLRRL